MKNKSKGGPRSEKQQNEHPPHESKKSKYLHREKTKIDSDIKKVLLFPGEKYEFNEKLIHYDAFGYSTGNLVSKKCGILLCDSKGKAIENSNEEIYKSLGKYYSPKLDDPIIGTIVQKTSEFYRVDIGSYTHAILNTIDFEGATKKAKPNLHLGDLIFARIAKLNKFDAVILSCVSLTETKTWASGESFFGNLKGGNLFSFNKLHTWDLYKNNYAINRLIDILNFEIVIGFNGKLWINSDSSENIFDIYEIIMSSLTKTNDEIEKIIHFKFLDSIKNK